MKLWRRFPPAKARIFPRSAPDGRYGYVANFASDDLTVWDCGDHRVIATIPRRDLIRTSSPSVQMESG